MFLFTTVSLFFQTLLSNMGYSITVLHFRIYVYIFFFFFSFFSLYIIMFVPGCTPVKY